MGEGHIERVTILTHGVPEVAAIGGSWITPKPLLDDGAWDRIEDLARTALAIRAEVREMGAGR